MYRTWHNSKPCATGKTEATPLEKQLQLLSKNLIWITLLTAVVIYIIGVAKGNGYFLMLETAIAMAVAAIPEACQSWLQ
jgi:Ca2+-transporting ATPase